MFCALNGATEAPRRRSHRHSPVTMVLLPAPEDVPNISRESFDALIGAVRRSPARARCARQQAPRADGRVDASRRSRCRPRRGDPRSRRRRHRAAGGAGALVDVGDEHEGNFDGDADEVRADAASAPSTVDAGRREEIGHGELAMAHEVEVHEVDARPRREQVEHDDEPVIEHRRRVRECGTEEKPHEREAEDGDDADPCARPHGTDGINDRDDREHPAVGADAHCSDERRDSNEREHRAEVGERRVTRDVDTVSASLTCSRVAIHAPTGISQMGEPTAPRKTAVVSCRREVFRGR